MKKILIACLLSASLASVSAEERIDGAWVLSEKWAGFMGIAILIKESSYQYWFYSDVRIQNEPNYPIQGKVTFQGDILVLTQKKDDFLYDSKWHVVTWKGRKCLLADRNYQDYQRTGNMPEDRLLFRVEHFDVKNPIMNAPPQNNE